MIRWDMGTVVECIEQHEDLQEIRVRMADGQVQTAIHYTDMFPELVAGDRVLLNTTAVSLGLGTGGVHFVYVVLETKRGRMPEYEAAGPEPIRYGHMMKLKYTPSQRSVLAAEEPDSPYHFIFNLNSNLQGMPVLIGELHSMLPVIICWLRYRKKHFAPKIAYIMSDGGALPLAFSNHVRILRELGWMEGTVTYGQAYGGDIETMNKFSGLIAARHILHADIAVVTMGPGIAGTGTPMGHTGMEVGELVNAVHSLGGVPIVIPRISFAESRERHFGLSHHLLYTLSKITLAKAAVPMPLNISGAEMAKVKQQIIGTGCTEKHDILWIEGITVDDIEQSQQAYPIPIKTMGRDLRMDPGFYSGVCAAAEYALGVLAVKK
jgi:hypothetical protein